MKNKLLFLLALLTSSSLFAQISGTYTIPSTVFPTIASAIQALNTQGIGNGATFNVTAGHTESVTAPLILSESGKPGGWLVFQKSGTGANPVITRTDAGSVATSVLAAQGDAVVILEGSDYVEFNAIDIAAGNSGIEYGYYLRKASGANGCKSVTIKNCNVTMTKAQYVAGIIVSNNIATSAANSAAGVAITDPAGRHENVIITGNTIGNVFTGILLRGWADPASPYANYDQGAIIGQAGAGNTIQNFGGGGVASTSYGIYSSYNANLTIGHNTIANAAGGGSNAASTIYGIYTPSGSTQSGGNLVIQNNNFTISQGSTAALNGIYNALSCSSVTISENFFGTGAFASTSSSYLIYNSSSTPNVNVTFNSTAGAISKTGSSGALYCYYNAGSGTGGTETVANNNFSNITVAGTSTLYGIYLSTTGANQYRDVVGNTLSFLNAGTGSFYGIYCAYTVLTNVFQNLISDVSVGGTVYAIQAGGTSTVTINTYNNTLENITTSGTTLYGFYCVTATNNNIYRNRIRNLTANSTVSGIYVSSGTNLQFYNNFISELKSPSSTNVNGVVGINLAAGTAASVFYNTVYLDAASSGATFGSSALYAVSGVALDLRNNILVNKSSRAGNTGFTVAYRRNGGISETNYLPTSNSNDLYASSGSAVGNYVFYDGTATGKDSSIADFQSRVAPRDAASFSENPPFINVANSPYDLHLQQTQSKCESGGSIVTSPPVDITVDFDLDPRYPNPGYPENENSAASAPDVGADEFAGFPTFSCSAPIPGNTLTSANDICLGQTITLTLENEISGTGNTFRWQQSPDNTTYVDVPDATLSSLVITPSQAAWYRCVVTCLAGPYTEISEPLFIHFSYEVTAATGGERCGAGSVKLEAEGTGPELNWYAVPEHGIPIGSGSPFFTPLIEQTTTYYVGTELFSSATVNIGTGTSTSTTYSNPFYSAYSHSHNQHLVLASDLIAAGLTGGPMTSLGIDITSAGSLPMIGFSLKLGNTTANNLANFVDVPMTVVYNADTLMPVVGINTMTFSAPFIWDGVSNVVIETCHGNPASTATMSRTCRVNTTTYIATVHVHRTVATSAADICSDITTTKTTYLVRPNFVFNGRTTCSGPRIPVTATVLPSPPFDVTENQAVCNNDIQPLDVMVGQGSFDVFTWSPVTNLFSDGACTVPYTGESAATVYMRSETAGQYTYTCTAFNSVNFCANIDEVTVTVLPASVEITSLPASLCLAGSALLSVSIPTGTGPASLQWMESTDGNVFTDIAGATGLVYQTTYLGQSMHYKLVVRNNKNAVCLSPVYFLEAINPLVTSTTPGFHCGPGVVELGATAASGLLNWFDNPLGGMPIASGPAFTTPYLWASKTYYVSALEPGSILESAGKLVQAGTASAATSNYGEVFTTNEYITLQSVDVYPVAAAGQVSVSLYNSSLQLLEGPIWFDYPAGNGSTPYTLHLNWRIPEGSGYRLIATVVSGGNLRRETSGITYPINNGTLVSLTAGASSLTGNSATVYNYFYNWRVLYGCASPLMPVLATINLAPFYELTLPQTVCNNDRATLTVFNGTSYFDSFTWSPVDHLFTDPDCTVPYTEGGNATTVYLKTDLHGTYEVRGYANNTVNGCTNFDTTSVTVLPATLQITADPDSLCISGSSVLTLEPSMNYGSAIIQWQISTDNSVFTDIPGATSSSYTTDTLTATTYYRVIVKNSSYNVCLTDDVAIVVESPQILSTTPGSRCGSGTVELGATASPGAVIKWYPSASGGALLGTGPNFTTPVISNTTTFYCAATGPNGASGTLGPPTAGSSSTYTLQAGLIFDVYAPNMLLHGVYIYPIGTGEGIVNIALKNDVGQVLESVAFPCTGTAAPGVKTYVPLGWTIPAGYGYWLDMTSRTGLVASLVRDLSSTIVGGAIATNPYCNFDGMARITSGRLSASGTSTTYYYFYDWIVSSGCSTPNIPVVATVYPANPVNITPSRTICANAVHPMTVTSQVADYDVYTWTPVENLYIDEAATLPYVTGMNRTTVYFKSAVGITTTYTCAGVNTLNGCNSTAQSTVTAIPFPVLTSSPEEICVSDSATLMPIPSTGYGIATFQWQSSTDNVNFTNIPGATNITYVTPVVSTVSYYKLKIYNSMGQLCSEPTYTLNVNNPHILTTTPGERCGPGTVELMATGEGGTVKWYESAVGGLSVGTGETFITPLIFNTTSYFAAVASPGATEAFVGMPASVSGTSGAGVNTYGLFFDAYVPFTLKTVNVYPNSSTNNTPGTVTISVIDMAGTVLNQAVVNVIGYTQSTNPNMQTVDLNFNILPGTALRLVMTAKSTGISGLMFQPSSQAPYPYPYVLPGILAITSGTYTGVVRPELYYYFYNWKVQIGCESARTEVLASVIPPPELILSESKAVCPNEVYPISVLNPLVQFDNYTWSPVTNLFFDAACTQPYTANTYATTVYFKSATPGQTTYTCNSLNNTSGCTNIEDVVVTVLPVTEIVASPEELCYTGNATLSLEPETGYGNATFQWQESTDNVVFTDIAGSTGLTYSTPTLTQTRYYKVVIRNGSGVICSEPVLTMTVNNPQVLSTVPGTRCGVGTVILQATASPGSTLKWYETANSSTPIGTGSPFHTPVVSSSTSFFVSATSGEGGTGAVGPVDNTIGAGSNQSLSYYEIFDVLSPSATIQGVHVYPGAAGYVRFYIANSSGTVLHNIVYAVTAGNVNLKTYIPVNVTLPAGTNYRMGYTSGSGGVSMYRNTAGAVYPYTLPGVVAITGNSFSGYPQYYYYFYDWRIQTGCESPRVEVAATLTSAPAVTANASPVAVCSGSPSTLTATSSNPNYTYNWTPGNLAGASVVVHPTSATTYTVLGTDNTTGCANGASVSVSISPTPSPITINPSSATIEPGMIQALTTTGGTIGGSGVFGSGTGTNTTTGYPAPYTNYYGGTKHQMLIRVSELVAAGLYNGAPITSISFNVTAVGSSFPGQLSNFQIDMGHTTQTSLSSSAFVAGLTNVLPAGTQPVAVGTVTHTLATPFIWNGVDNLVIQTSYSNGNTGTSAYMVQMTNTDPGFTSTNWYRADGATAATILAATTPSGSSNVRPNMVIQFATAVPMTWSPIAGLYTDAAATIPYTTGMDRRSVFAKPAATTTYTARAQLGLFGCFATKSVTITVAATPLSLSTTLTNAGCPLDQNGAIDLTVTGGTPPYTYLWSNGATTQDLTGLAPGTYAVTVTSATSATVNGSWYLGFTDPVCQNLSVSGTVSSTVCYDAHVTITVAGGGNTWTLVAPGGNAEFVAGQNILYMPGTTVQPGSYMWGHISTNFCAPTKAVVANTVLTEEENAPVAAANFSLFPNPTNGNVTLVVRGDRDFAGLEVEIYNTNGNRVMQTYMTGEKRKEFATSQLPAGLYFVRVVADDYVETFKLVKTR